MQSILEMFTAKKKNNNSTTKKNNNNSSTKKNNNNNLNENTKRRKNTQIEIYKKLFEDSILKFERPLWDFIDDVVREGDGKKDLSNIKFVMKQLSEYQDVISDKSYIDELILDVSTNYGEGSHVKGIVYTLKQGIQDEIEHVKKFIKLLKYKIDQPTIDRWDREYKEAKRLEDERFKAYGENVKKQIKIQYEKWKKHTGLNISLEDFYKMLNDGELTHYNFDTGEQMDHKRKDSFYNYWEGGARTRQTARMSTGSKTPRMTLPVDADNSSPRNNGNNGNNRNSNNTRKNLKMRTYEEKLSAIHELSRV